MFFIFTPDYDAKLKKFESNSKYFTQFLWRKLKKVPKKTIGMKDLESKIKKKLSEQSMTIQRLATESGVSEPTLHAIFNRGDAKLSQLEKIAGALGTTLSFLLGDESQTSVIQTGGFNQSGGGNFQKVKVSKAPAQELAVQLDSCLKEVDHLKEKLVYANQTIASKDETISLLRGTYRNPN